MIIVVIVVVVVVCSVGLGETTGVRRREEMRGRLRPAVLPVIDSNEDDKDVEKRETVQLFVNGTIYGSSVGETVEAFAIDETSGRIIAIGTTAEMLQQFPSAVSTVDFQGRTVIPGFIEGHAHLMSLGSSLLRADLNPAKSEDECIDILRPFFDELPAGAWLLARGWDNERWVGNTSFPTKSSLDAAFGSSTPAYLTRVDGHAAWVNSAALALAELPDEDPPGGQIIRDDNGEPTGVLIDTAMDFVSVHIPPPTEEEQEIAMTLALQEMVRYGITSHHDAGADEAFVDRVKRFIDQDRLPLRVYVMIFGRPNEWCDRMLLDYGNGRLTLRATKIMMDGALGSYGAAMIEPYTDAPTESGTIIVPYPEFVANVKGWLRCGWQVNTHAIGDKANRNVLLGYIQALRELGLQENARDLRLRGDFLTLSLSILSSSVIYPLFFFFLKLSMRRSSRSRTLNSSAPMDS